MEYFPATMDIKHIYADKFPNLFKRILICWKDAPTHDSWIMEKVMELFCKEIAHDLELVKTVGFNSFLESFFEDNKLIEYPDFVMNNVSLMAGQVLLSASSDDLSCFEKPAFRIIQAPLQYWMVKKGHRVDVTFLLYQKFLHQNAMLHLLEEVDFDAPQAFAHALTSPFNYTRKSAADYFVQLVKFSFQPLDEIESSAKMRLRLQGIMSAVIQQFNEVAGKQMDDLSGKSKPDGPPVYPWSVFVNYCQLASDCAAASPDWCRLAATTTLFDIVLDVLQAAPVEIITDAPDLTRSCASMLVKLLQFSTEHGKKEKLDQLRDVIQHLCTIDHYTITCDVISAAGIILTSWENLSEDDQKFYLELSVLPLFLALCVRPQSVLTCSKHIITAVKTFLESELNLKPSRMMKEAISNLHLITDSSKKMMVTNYRSVLDYLSFKSTESPPIAGQSIITGDSIHQKPLITLVALQMETCRENIKDGKGDDCLHSVQIYTEAALNSSGTALWQLSSVLDCYLTTLSCISSRETVGVSSEILDHVLKSVQVKMVDRDPSIRELAVQAAGHLYLVGNPQISSMLISSGCLLSMWQCVEDQMEGVATKVVEILVQAAKKDMFYNLLAPMNTTQEVIKSKLEGFLLARQWEYIQPVAFQLLTKLCPSNTLVRCARACLQHSNYLLSQAVLEHINSLVSIPQEDGGLLEQKVQAVESLLAEGWADLLLLMANGQDVCSFRLSVSAMESLLLFMNRTDVAAVIEAKLKSACLKLPADNEECAQRLKVFQDVCEEILSLNGHISCVYNQSDDSDEFQAKKPKLDCSLIKDNSNSGCQFKSLHGSQAANSFLSAVINQNASVIASGHPKLSGDISTEKLDSNLFGKDEDFYLDTTKELLPLTLSFEPFQSHKLIDSVISLDVMNDSLITLALWLAFHEILQRINPRLLRQEAARSTDQYERNSLMLLHDLDKVLNRSFNNCQRQMEVELGGYFMNQFSSLLAYQPNTDGEVRKEVLLKTVTNLVSKLQHSSKNENILVTFVLDQRKILFDVPDVSKEMFIVDVFLAQMNVPNQQSGVNRSPFQPLCKLFDLYLQSSVSQQTLVYFQKSSRTTSANEQSCEVAVEPYSKRKILNGTGENAQDINSIIKASLCAFGVSSASQSELSDHLKSMKPQELISVYELGVSCDGGRETLSESIANCLQSKKKNSFPLLLNCLLSMMKQLLLAIFDFDKKSSQEKLSFLSVCFKQMEDWFLSDGDFDSDGDNDPAALDCF
ncbi:unnamed protein product [Lymnaea stagnalis]|uniref:HEAT repeat-containing protein 1 n=1 Tax=Lymnaea stagnalis TaxID=6523 RepID=A0AAV2HAH2_LYMST